MRNRGRRRAFDGPQPVGIGVKRVMRHLRAPEPAVVQSVFDHWDDLVGELIGAHCRPAKIVDGTLVVEVDDPAWAAELKWLAGELTERIQTRLDTNEINEISVKLVR